IGMVSKEYIKIEHITKKFGDVKALDDVNLEIQQGSFFGIIGLSGSGKTTLMNMIISFWKPTMGKISFGGVDVHKHRNFIVKQFGFATQATSVYRLLTVEENMKYFGKMYGMRKRDIQKRTEILLDLMHMTGTNHVLAKELSTGMMRRLDIACALIHNPKVLLLDEPTEDLDPVLRKELLALNKKINDDGTTIIMTSHMLDEVETVCDKIAILHGGRLIATDAPEKLKEKYSKNEEIHITTVPGKYDNLVKKFRQLPISNIVMKSKKVVLYTPDASKILDKILSIINEGKEKIVDLRVNKPSMEEVFEYITKR
ncbi:MAG: ABC transporter ATP-binding protein, partial [Nanoarchaeota archaeon]|nr:ABC transporter ATP-binding protein [Nanoarchaeota archaeon]